MKIKKVGVVGCGIMGCGIAQVCSQAGFDVVVMDTKDEYLEKGFATIEKVLARSVEKERVTADEKEAIQSRIKGTITLEDFSDCDYVVEAVIEELEAKKDVFKELDRICPEHTILASNTSTISIINIAAATNRPHKVIGTHFSNPVPLMKVVEVINAISTEEETTDITRAFLESIDKTMVVSKDVPGFLSNRILTPFLLNAVRMVEAGVGTKEDIDTLITQGLRHPMGPLTLLDLIGIDTVYRGATTIYEEIKDPQYLPPTLMKQMVIAGWHGRKTGKGFYEYK
jgi:3-hydroxybutyryl-CoA dehydrogenase